MKKKLRRGLAFKFLIIFMVSVVLTNLLTLAEACTKTTDDYAVEIVLEKPGIVYNPDALAEARNIEIEGSDYVYRSHYNPDIAVVISKNQPIVRLQYPTKNTKKEIPYFKLVSNNFFYNFEINQTESIVPDWKQQCTEEIEPSKCVFEKEHTSLTVNKIAKKKYSVTLEIIGENISSCSSREYCPGNCVYYSGKGSCIPLIIVHNIEDLLVKTNTIRDFDELVRNIKIERKINEVYEMQAQGDNYDSINWKEAVKRELTWLKLNGVTNLGFNDIENVSEISYAGRADDSRIIYGEDKNKTGGWLYYSDSLSPVLNKVSNCEEFPESRMPTGMIVFQDKDTLYYTVPIVITSLVFLLFIITLIIARIKLKTQRKPKPITTLYKAEEKS